MNMKLKLITIAVAVIAVLGIVGAVLYQRGVFSQLQDDPEVPKVAPAIAGQVACLPLKDPDTAPTSDSVCEKGLKNDRGLFLILKNKPQSELKVGEKIEVHGNFSPTSEDSPYMTGGTITVQQ
jgi:hypothetical protein